MKRISNCRSLLRLSLVAAALSVSPLGAAKSAANPPESPPAAERDGRHDFDFEVGRWHVHHRVLRPTGSHDWSEFDGTSSDRQQMGGLVNVEDNIFDKPAGVTRGLALRAYDPKTRQWAIWWIDSRDPLGALDPPVTGRFDQGVGTFYSDGTLDGKPMRTRFIWSHITRTSARWEQALSFDAGQTWETNWIMEFRRAS